MTTFLTTHLLAAARMFAGFGRFLLAQTTDMDTTGWRR